MAKAPANLAAAVRQRLHNLARSDGRDFQTLLVAFGLERLIFRLSQSAHRDKFVLKGGMLVALWTADPDRFTRDVAGREVSGRGRARSHQWPYERLLRSLGHPESH